MKYTGRSPTPTSFREVTLVKRILLLPILTTLLLSCGTGAATPNHDLFLLLE